MRNKKWLLILMSLLLVMGMIGLSGCGKDSSNGNGEELTKKDYRVTLFFANEEYIKTGDESLEKYMVVEQEINTTPDKIYLETLEALKASAEEGCGTLVTETIKFNSVYLDGNTANVDLSSEGLNGGSLEETFLIGQIVNTLIQSFDEIEQVQFLVDGKPAESLMGHFDAAQPFRSDLFSE